MGGKSFYFAFLALPVVREPRRSLIGYATIKEQSAGGGGQ